MSENTERPWGRPPKPFVAHFSNGSAETIRARGWYSALGIARDIHGEEGPDLVELRRVEFMKVGDFAEASVVTYNFREEPEGERLEVGDVLGFNLNMDNDRPIATGKIERIQPRTIEWSLDIPGEGKPRFIMRFEKGQTDLPFYYIVAFRTEPKGIVVLVARLIWGESPGTVYKSDEAVEFNRRIKRVYPRAVRLNDLVVDPRRENTLEALEKNDSE